MKKHSYAGVATSVYLDYAIVGIATIFLSQYSTFFQKAWNTNVKGVSLVLSVVGLGRILTILFAGVISDKIGRKKTLLISIVADIIFLLGAAYSHNVIVAGIAALFFGVTNSFGDTAAYPALGDAFPNRAATMNSLIKAAMSVAQFLFPFWVSAIHDARVTAIVLAIVLLVDIVITCMSAFAPQSGTKKASQENTDTSEDTDSGTGNKPKMAIDGVLIIILSFTTAFTFYVFSQYAPNFGINVLGASAAAGKTLVSWYSMASLISVFVTAALVTKVKPLTLILIYTTVSALGLLLMLLAPSITTARIGALIIGFFAAGGIWQVGLAVLTDYFPKNHGKLTSYYSFMAAVVYFVGPLLASFVISDTAASVISIFWIMTIDTIISIVITAVLLKRSHNFD